MRGIIITNNTNKDTDRYKLFDRTEQDRKVTQFLTLLKEPEIQTFLKTIIEATLATSDLKILKRLSKVEAALGLLDEELLDEKEAQEPSIPAQIAELKDDVTKLNTALKPDLVDRSLVLPSKNVTEIRADYLIEYMRAHKDLLPKAVSPFVNIESRVMDSKDFKTFVNSYLPSDFQPESTKNLRKMKKDVFEAVEKRCTTNDIFIDKADHGRNELRLIYARQIPVEELSPWFSGPEPTVTT
jgi:hypothetical protein